MREPSPRPVAFRGGGFQARPRPAAAWIAVALVLVLWQGVAAAGLVDEVFLPSPLGILNALRDLTLSGALWRHLSVSLTRIGAGWAVGTAAGIALGFAIGLYSLARAVGVPF